jgi:hypothetical protein
MTKTARTLATLSQDDIDQITLMIKQGYGAYGIRLESHFTLKQINAVFALVRG